MIGYLIAGYSGYVVVRAALCWISTVRALGLRRALTGARMMLRIRLHQIWEPRQDISSALLPIAPTTPLLFELQVFLATALFVWISTGRNWGAVLALAVPLAPLFAVIAVARAAETVLPPSILYLGVSEPGHFEVFQYFARSYNLLTVSALDQEDFGVSGGELARSSLLFSFLMPRRIGRVPLAALIPRRRLESVRVKEKEWERAIRQIIDFAPVIIADLRSWSPIVSRELAWSLDTRSSNVVVISRDDGTTSIDAIVKQERIDLRYTIRAIVTERASYDLIDQLIRDRFQTHGRVISASGEDGFGSRLARRLEEDNRYTRALLEELTASTGHSPELDRKLWAWASGNHHRETPPNVTGSVAAAAELAKLRAPAFSSYSLHIGLDGTAWADIGVQILPRSYRVSDSGLQMLESPAKALVMSLLRGELGLARGLSQDTSRIRLFRDLDPLRDREFWKESNRERRELLDRVRENDTGFDALLEKRLTNLVGVGPVGGSLDELESAIRFVEALGAYSIAVYVTLEGKAWANVAAKGGMRGVRWLVSFSYDPPHERHMRPAQALIAAVLKAEMGIFEGVVQR